MKTLHGARKAANFAVVLAMVFGTSTVVIAQGRFVDVIVVLNPNVAPGGHAQNQTAAAQTANGLGVAANRLYGSALFGFAARVPEGRLQGLRNDPRVAYVNVDQTDRIPFSTPDAPRRCADDPTGPGCGGGGGGGNEDPPPPDPGGEVEPWGIGHINGGETNNYEGNGIHVYIIDSGIDSDHGDLNLDPDPNAHLAAEKCKGKGCREDWDDNNGHGTHVAGTATAVGSNDLGVVGVASQATLHAVKVCAKSGLCSRSAIIAGIDFVASQVSGSPVVANISIGGSGSKGTGTCSKSADPNNPALGYDPGSGAPDGYYQAICTAANSGVVFSVSAGNSNANAAGFVPAAYDDAVITVSATADMSNNFAGFSNWGPPVDLAAPGVNILSTWNDGTTNTLQGTSMASPHVAGTAALYLDTFGAAANYDAFQAVESFLVSTTVAINDQGNHTEDLVDAIGY